MGHESTVYGGIVSPQWKGEDSERLQRHNQAIVLALPEHDTWPFLTRPMFAFAGTTVEGGRYRSQIIHFGATLKAVEWEWDAWLEKFERLLTQLFWHDVYLHLRTESTVGDMTTTTAPREPSSASTRRSRPCPLTIGCSRVGRATLISPARIRTTPMSQAGCTSKVSGSPSAFHRR